METTVTQSNGWKEETPQQAHSPAAATLQAQVRELQYLLASKRVEFDKLAGDAASLSRELEGVKAELEAERVQHAKTGAERDGLLHNWPKDELDEHRRLKKELEHELDQERGDNLKREGQIERLNDNQGSLLLALDTAADELRAAHAAMATARAKGARKAHLAADAAQEILDLFKARADAITKNAKKMVAELNAETASLSGDAP